MKPNAFLIGVVFFVGSAGSLIWLSRNQDYGASNLTVEAHPTDGSIIIFVWDGYVDRPMARDFRRAFEAHKESAERFIIDLNSPGGALDEGEAVIQVIDDMKCSHRVETYVGSGNSCLSMCVPIYLQGRLRVAAADAEFMFHETSFSNRLTGQREQVYEFEKRQASVKFFNKYLERSEIDPEWLERLAVEWRGQEVWKTGRELKDERSNIVMVVE